MVKIKLIDKMSSHSNLDLVTKQKGLNNGEWLVTPGKLKKGGDEFNNFFRHEVNLPILFLQPLT
jgi:hypothetical protein